MNLLKHEALLEIITKTTEAFRQGREADGNERLLGFVDGFSQICPDLPAESVLKLPPLLEEALKAISRRDFLWAADILDYEIKPLLQSLPSDTTHETDTT